MFTKSTDSYVGLDITADYCTNSILDNLPPNVISGQAARQSAIGNRHFTFQHCGHPTPNEYHPHQSIILIMSDGDSSSSEDVPLASLGAARKKKKTIQESSEEEAEFDEEESEQDEEMVGGDEPDTDDFVVEDSEADDDDGDYDSDSSDDVPLSSLKSAKKKTPAKKEKAAPKKKASSTKKAAPKKKKETKAKASSAKKKTSSKASFAKSGGSNYLCPSNELYSNCDKGKLIQSLLARWWYAYQWPDPKDLPTEIPPGYDALDGFPGVYICGQGSEVGTIKDVRKKATAPTFNNFAKKSTEELQTMLLKAIEKQKKVLIQHEGEGTDTERELVVLEKWVGKLDSSKADRQVSSFVRLWVYYCMM